MALDNLSADKLDSNRIVTVYCTFPDRDSALTAARKIVQEELAACANILGEIRSVYRWQGEVNDAREVAILFKTRFAALEALRTRIKALHSYDLPGITVWAADESDQQFADWIVTQTGGTLY